MQEKHPEVDPGVQRRVAADKPNTALMKFRQAVVALKAAPSKLPAPHTQLNRYDDYVYIHQQSMAGTPAHDPAAPRTQGSDVLSVASGVSAAVRERPPHRLRRSVDLSAVLGLLARSSARPIPDIPSSTTSSVERRQPGAGNRRADRRLRARQWVDVESGRSNCLAAAARSLGNALVARRPLAITGALAETTYDSASVRLEMRRCGQLPKSRGRMGRCRSLAPNVHNRVHVWVGGSMGPSTSPNDPVFFLNHAKEDELWAVWIAEVSDRPALPAR